MLSRVLITVITCSIIFSYAVLCPQASTTFTPVITYSPGDASIVTSPPSYDCLGSDNLMNLAFTPDFYLLYDCDRTSYSNSPNFVDIEISFYANEDMDEPIIVDSTFSISFAYCITYDDTEIIPDNGVLTISLWTDLMSRILRRKHQRSHRRKHQVQKPPEGLQGHHQDRAGQYENM